MTGKTHIMGGIAASATVAYFTNYELCDEGMTIFMSTHILEIAEQMCYRVGIIKDGELITVATMEELKRESGGRPKRLIQE